MRRIRGGQLVKAMLFGVAGTLIGIALNAAIDYAQQDWTNPLGVGVVVVLASVSAMIPILQGDKSGETTTAPPGPVGHAGYIPAAWPHGGGPLAPPVHPSPPARLERQRRLPLAAAALVLLLVCGGGAAALTLGVQYVGGYLTGDESGDDLLVAEKSATAGSLTIAVHRVVVTAHFTKVDMTAANRGIDSLNLPVFGYCQLSADNGTTLKADPFRSDWPETVPAEGSVRGTVTFGRRLPDGTNSVSLSFTHIFGTLGGPQSITVRDIAVR